MEKDQNIEDIMRDLHFAQHMAFLKGKDIDINKLYCKDTNYDGKRCKECENYDKLCPESTLITIFKH